MIGYIFLYLPAIERLNQAHTVVLIVNSA